MKGVFMIIKQPPMPIRGDRTYIPISLRVPEHYKELLKLLGSGNINAGINILMYSLEDDLKKVLLGTIKKKVTKKVVKKKVARR